jgi:hypothetical protein
MEASVLTGKNINLQRARYLAFTGDIIGMQNEVLNQIEKIGNWEKMNVFQKGAIAKAAGMEVDELQKTIALRKWEKDLLGSNLMAYTKYQNILTENADLEKAANDPAMIAQRQNSMMKLQQAWDRIGSVLVESILPVFEAMEPILNAVTSILKFMVPILTPLMKLLAPLLKVLGFVLTGTTAIGLAPLASTLAMVSGATFGPGALVAGGANKTINSFDTGAIVTKPTRGVFGDAGPEAVLPLSKAPQFARDMNLGTDNKQVVAKIDELIDVIKSGFNVNIDGKKAGDFIAGHIQHPLLSAS